MKLHITRIARWYILLGRAQADTGCFLPEEVEAYLAQLLYRLSSSSDPENVSVKPVFPDGLVPVAGGEGLARQLQMLEQCLLLAGIFPGRAARCGLSLQLFIDKGRRASRNLAEALPESGIFAYLDRSFIQIIDILQSLTYLAGAERTADLLQACELWQSAGSQRSFKVLKRNTTALPSARGSELRH